MKYERLPVDKFTVPSDRRISLADYDPGHTTGLDNKHKATKAMLDDISRLAEKQELLWASSQYSVLIILQAMDAAGKDGTIKHVMSGVNPQGCEVHSFKAPTEEERKHHFLWRPLKYLPAKGRIAIFNRSYYEEVLVVRVHPEFLSQQWTPETLKDQPLEKIWNVRYEEICQFEKWMSANNTCIIKLFLHVSKEEQKKRFLERLDNESKYWKFSPADLHERSYWDNYQSAYEDMLNATSTPYAPWYIIPADKKWFMRALVADIITSRISELKMGYPEITEKHRAELRKARKELMKEK